MKIVILGRENVGKSTIFNKLSKNNISIVSNIGGSTCDFIINKCFYKDIYFNLLDTSGWNVNCKIKNSTFQAIEYSNLLFFIVDNIKYFIKKDIKILNKLYFFKKKIILIINKSEKFIKILYKLINNILLKNIIFLSSEHNLGFDKLYNYIKNFKDIYTNYFYKNNKLVISIIGKPNVGKSTLLNILLQYNKNATSNISGTTKDLINCYFQYNYHLFNLIDTAGIRRFVKLFNIMNILSTQKVMVVVQKSNIVILIVNSITFINHHDLKINNIIFKKFILFLIIFNKIDLLKNLKVFNNQIYFFLINKFSQFNDVYVMYSILNKNFNQSYFFKSLLNIHHIYYTYICPSKINKWLSYYSSYKDFFYIKKNIKFKIKYIRQIGVAPIFFHFFINISLKLYNNIFFKRLIKNLKYNFNLYGVIIKIKFIYSINPYIIFNKKN